MLQRGTQGGHAPEAVSVKCSGEQALTYRAVSQGGTSGGFMHACFISSVDVVRRARGSSLLLLQQGLLCCRASPHVVSKSL